MGAIIFRKREHLFERQRVVRTLKIMALMGPIAREGPGSIRAQRSAWLPAVSLRSLIAAPCRDDSIGVWELVDSHELTNSHERKNSHELKKALPPTNHFSNLLRILFTNISAPVKINGVIIASAIVLEINKYCSIGNGAISSLIKFIL